MDFLIVVFLIAFFLMCVLGLLGLVFGGEDPYERELREYDRTDEIVDALNRRDPDIFVDARSLHIHKHWDT